MARAANAVPARIEGVPLRERTNAKTARVAGSALGIQYGLTGGEPGEPGGERSFAVQHRLLRGKARLARIVDLRASHGGEKVAVGLMHKGICSGRREDANWAVVIVVVCGLLLFLLIGAAAGTAACTATASAATSAAIAAAVAAAAAALAAAAAAAT